MRLSHLGIHNIIHFLKILFFFAVGFEPCTFDTPDRCLTRLANPAPLSDANRLPRVSEGSSKFYSAGLPSSCYTLSNLVCVQRKREGETCPSLGKTSHERERERERKMERGEEVFGEREKEEGW